MSTTAIEWTDAVWNPTTGCDRVSPGCDNCYALTLARRLKGMGSAKYQRDGDPRTSGPGFGLTVHGDALETPLRWRKPRKVFVNSMSDLFHKDVPDGFVGDAWNTMALAKQHTFQILTKRPARARALLRRWTEDGATWRRSDMHWCGPVSWPLPNVWLGTSVEDQKRADLRIPALLETPAAVRFLSCEPLLGPVDLSPWLNPERTCERCDAPCTACPFDRSVMVDADFDPDTGHQPVRHVDWVIVGGESGPGARPMHPDWARSLRDQCQTAGVPYFFKQWGEWCPSGAVGIGSVNPSRSIVVGPPMGEHGVGRELVRVGKKAAGRELDGRTWDEFPAAAR